MLDQTLIDAYADRLRGDKNARQQYLAIIAAWGKHVKSAPDRASIDKRIQEMESAGYAPGTVLHHFNQIRSFYNCNKLEWPYRRGEGPKIRERDVIKLALNDDLIERMVKVARRGLVSPVDTVNLALSTVYGMRRGEIGGITAADIKLPERTLYVETIHNGRERDHVIPEAIVPYIEAALPHIKRPRSAKAVTRSFYRVERATGLEHTLDLGWHSIRRSLDTRLLENTAISESSAQNFMRWKVAGANMARRYARGNTFVSGAGASVVQSIGDNEIDLQIFAVHPFLKFWEAD